MKSTAKGRQDNARYRLLLIIIFTRITLFHVRMQGCVDEGHYRACGCYQGRCRGDLKYLAGY